MSAKDDNIPEAPTLKLSSNEVTVANSGGNAQAISIQTNQETWQAIAGADWVQTSQQGNNLVITVAPNPSSTDRKTEIGVYAGSATPQKVTVKQSAADIVLEVSPETIVIPNSGATKLISITNNTSNWELIIDDADKSWITVTKFCNFAELQVAPNNGEERSAKLYAQSGKAKPIEITVKQAGTSVSLFHAPLLESFPTSYKIMAHENEQKSFLLGFSAANPGLPSWGISPSGESLEFATSSEMLPTVSYKFNYDKGHLEFISYESEIEFSKFLESGYEKFLKESLGFDVEMKNGILLGVHKENKFKVTALEYQGKTAVLFEGPTPPDPEQLGPQDTFEKIPLIEMTEHLFTKEKKGWLLDDVSAWETKNGGTVLSDDKKDSEGNIKYIRYEGKAKELTHRQYWFIGSDDDEMKTFPDHKGELKHLGIIIDNLSYVFWKDDKGKYYLTKEFVAKMKSEGFELFGVQAPWYWFTNGNKIFGWRIVSYQDVADGKNLLSGQAYIDHEEEASSAKFMLFKDKQTLMNRWAKAMK